MSALEKKFNAHSTFVLHTLVVIMWLTFVLMVFVLLGGLAKIGYGIYIEFAENDNNGLVSIFHGVEIVLVSPVAYLFVVSFTKYINATRIEFEPDLDKKKKFMKHSILEITNAKIFTIGLFISLLFLHTIDLVLQKEVDNGLLLYVLPLIAVLIIFYFLLDKVSEKLRD